MPAGGPAGRFAAGTALRGSEEGIRSPQLASPSFRRRWRSSTGSRAQSQQGSQGQNIRHARAARAGQHRAGGVGTGDGSLVRRRDRHFNGVLRAGAVDPILVVNLPVHGIAVVVGLGDNDLDAGGQLDVGRLARIELDGCRRQAVTGIGIVGTKGNGTILMSITELGIAFIGDACTSRCCSRWPTYPGSGW